jgi:hypothetical protein
MFRTSHLAVMAAVLSACSTSSTPQPTSGPVATAADRERAALAARPQSDDAARKAVVARLQRGQPGEVTGVEHGPLVNSVVVTGSGTRLAGWFMCGTVSGTDGRRSYLAEFDGQGNEVVAGFIDRAGNRTVARWCDQVQRNDLAAAGNAPAPVVAQPQPAVPAPIAAQPAPTPAPAAVATPAAVPSRAAVTTPPAAPAPIGDVAPRPAPVIVATPPTIAARAAVAMPPAAPAPVAAVAPPPVPAPIVLTPPPPSAAPERIVLRRPPVRERIVLRPPPAPVRVTAITPRPASARVAAATPQRAAAPWAAESCRPGMIFCSTPAAKGCTSGVIICSVRYAYWSVAEVFGRRPPDRSTIAAAPPRWN